MKAATGTRFFVARSYVSPRVMARGCWPARSVGASGGLLFVCAVTFGSGLFRAGGLGPCFEGGCAPFERAIGARRWGFVERGVRVVRHAG